MSAGVGVRGEVEERGLRTGLEGGRGGLRGRGAGVRHVERGEVQQVGGGRVAARCA